MKPTHRTPRKENPGAGGHGPARQRGHAFMADKSKREWAEEALDGRERIDHLRRLLGDVLEWSDVRPDLANKIHQALGENRE